MSLHHGLRAAAGASPADPYFSSTSLLLLGNGTNGGQNNTFVDSSTNSFAITRYGNTTQGSFGPFGYNWSNYFDGSGDYLSVADNAAFDLPADFTVECWINLSSTSNSFPRVFSFGTYNAANNLDCSIDTSTKYLVVWFNGTQYDSGASTINFGTWHHIAIVRSGSTIKAYVDGTIKITISSATASVERSQPFYIGNLHSFESSTTAAWQGFISSFRILKGTAQYTSNFTPPTSPLTAITNTSLLTCQSNRFLDNSSNAFTITPYGDASVTNFAPFPTNSEYSTGVNGGSGYFDGSGDYLSIAANSAIQFGTGDYTIDFWVYPLQSGRQDMIDMPGTNRLQVAYEGTNTAIYINQTFIAGSAVAPTINAWNHIAATRLGTSTRVFLNGTQLGSTATNSTNFSDNSLKIVDTTSGTTPLKGYLAGLRVVKGGALYTASYTVPTAPPTTTVSSGTVGALLNFTNASIIDSTGKNNLETVGDAQISTSVKKFGTGSMYFDGNGNYLKFPHSPDFSLGSGDWTMECWVYITSAVNYNGIICKRDPNTFDSYSFGTDVSNNFWLTIANASNYHTIAGATLATGVTTNTWHHLAVVRKGNIITGFLNGVAGTPQSFTGSVYDTGKSLFIGNSDGGANGQNFNGYIDDFRITKGVARYVSNFTPPAAQLPSR